MSDIKPELKAKLKNLYINGKTIGRLSYEYSIPYSQLKALLRGEPKNTQSILDKTMDILQMRVDGKTFDQIAVAIQKQVKKPISPNTISRIYKANTEMEQHFRNMLNNKNDGVSKS